MQHRSSDLATCYVGISFYRSANGNELHTAVAQVFNERGNGVVVRSGITQSSKSDRLRGPGSCQPSPSRDAPPSRSRSAPHTGQHSSVADPTSIPPGQTTMRGVRPADQEPASPSPTQRFSDRAQAALPTNTGDIGILWNLNKAAVRAASSLRNA